MTIDRAARTALVLGLIVALSGCGGSGLRGIFGSSPEAQASAAEAADEEVRRERLIATGSTDSIWDMFTRNQDPSATLSVNRYIWTAALETLDFLPVETVDPFSGVFTTGFGTPPGGGRPYRATVQVTDVALDARSLNVALATRNGPASAETVRAVENAILTRARQLRIQDRNL